MYIVAIGWMYVVTLMAATETSFIAGLVTFLFYGLLPCSVLMYILGAGRRRAKIKARELAEQELQTGQPDDASQTAERDEKKDANL
ncbi:MAG: hypothetical protein R3194_08650 [Limnobacter sp.]|nr:hypothetical protein [Limnobacter sp.]